MELWSAASGHRRPIDADSCLPLHPVMPTRRDVSLELERRVTGLLAAIGSSVAKSSTMTTSCRIRLPPSNGVRDTRPVVYQAVTHQPLPLRAG